jgi:hypothetical protein
MRAMVSIVPDDIGREGRFGTDVSYDLCVGGRLDGSEARPRLHDVGLPEGLVALEKHLNGTGGRS